MKDSIKNEVAEIDKEIEKLLEVDQKMSREVTALFDNRDSFNRLIERVCMFCDKSLNTSLERLRKCRDILSKNNDRASEEKLNFLKTEYDKLVMENKSLKYKIAELEEDKRLNNNVIDEIVNSILILFGVK